MMAYCANVAHAGTVSLPSWRSSDNSNCWVDDSTLELRNSQSRRRARTGTMGKLVSGFLGDTSSAETRMETHLVHAAGLTNPVREGKQRRPRAGIEESIGRVADFYKARGVDDGGVDIRYPADTEFTRTTEKFRQPTFGNIRGNRNSNSRIEVGIFDGARVRGTPGSSGTRSPVGAPGKDRDCSPWIRVSNLF